MYDRQNEQVDGGFRFIFFLYPLLFPQNVFVNFFLFILCSSTFHNRIYLQFKQKDYERILQIKKLFQEIENGPPILAKNNFATFGLPFIFYIHEISK